MYFLCKAHRARTVLEADRTSRMTGVLNVDGFGSVQDHDHMGSVPPFCLI